MRKRYGHLLIADLWRVLCRGTGVTEIPSSALEVYKNYAVTCFTLFFVYNFQVFNLRLIILYLLFNVGLKNMLGLHNNG